MTQSTNIIADKLSWKLEDVSGKRVLDIGCGKGKWAFYLRAECEHLNRPANITGVEFYEPYINFCKRYNIYDNILQLDLETIDKLPFEDREFDVVICTETLEHLTMNSGRKIIKDIDRICKQTSIITIPAHFYEQEEYDGNTKQKHLTKYDLEEFRRNGYQVIGLGFDSKSQIIGQILHFIGRVVPKTASTWFLFKDYNK